MDPTRSVLSSRRLILLALLVVAGAALRATSSWDYPGPCFGESVAPSFPQSPLYLSADYHGVNPSAGVIVMPDFGRIRLGISCVATGFVVARIGPDSALCTMRGRCDLNDLPSITQDDIAAVSGIPGEIPFLHICRKHGFGWYDVVGLSPGTYLAIADSRSGVFGLVDGHGTADTYSFFGNGGAWQPVNCSITPPPPPPPDDGGGGGGGCGNGNPDLPQMPCQVLE